MLIAGLRETVEGGIVRSFRMPRMSNHFFSARIALYTPIHTRVLLPSLIMRLYHSQIGISIGERLFFEDCRVCTSMYLGFRSFLLFYIAQALRQVFEKLQESQSLARNIV